MTCANVLLTLAAAVVFAFGAWPRFGGASAWVVGIAAIIIVVIAWTGADCKWCAPKKKR